MSHYTGLGGQNRDDWTFKYSAGELAVAAAKQLDYRLLRVAAWEKKKGEVMQRIKDSGLTIYESQAEKMSSYSDSDNRARVLVDPKYQKDLDEATNKIKEHRLLVKEYEAWVQVLKAQPGILQYDLKVADWMFFFGK